MSVSTSEGPSALSSSPNPATQAGATPGVDGRDRGPGQVVAAIDIGTNSFHMVVARSLASGGFDIITTEKESVRLGEGAGEMKSLSQAAMDRGVAALIRMLLVAESHGATVAAVATSAVREADNRQDFLDRVFEQTGLKIEVISGVEEARLIHLGVLQALPVFDQRLLMIDIGGGSTEFLIGQGEQAMAARSIKLGAIRLTDMFFAEIDRKQNSRKQIKELSKAAARCRKYVRNLVTPVANDLASLGHTIVIGCSGTITTLATMAAARAGMSEDSGARSANHNSGNDNSEKSNSEKSNSENDNGESGNSAAGGSLTLTSDELDDLVQLLIETAKSDRSGIVGLDAKREDIILGGAVLLQVAFELFDIQSLTVSPFALREGVLYDRLETGLSGQRLADLRRSNAWRLAHQLDPDAVHAETCAKHALTLFDKTSELHNFGSWERQMLEMAALVHNVGLFLSHAAHHKHTYYIVRNSEQLTGFTDRELELLALVARYHRKSHPSIKKHVEFARLDDADRHRVRVLAGLLRVAIGLDRGHNRAISQITVDHGGDGLKITVAPREIGSDLALEVFAAQERSNLLSVALDIPIRILAGLDGGSTQ